LRKDNGDRLQKACEVQAGPFQADGKKEKGALKKPVM
jgi:hypothetical protein